MSDFTVKGSHVDVEQIMRQIRARIREKRGVDYTEEEIRELAGVRLERILDPNTIRSGLVEQFRKSREASPPETYEFEADTIYESHRLPLLRSIRRLLNPVLKLFFNPNPIIRALHLNSKLYNRLVLKEELDYEVMSNLVLELTRMSVEVKNLKMRIESMSARLDFDERRARALEGVVQYKPGALSPAVQASDGEREVASTDETGEGRASRRRRRRRRRRPGAPGGETAAGGAPSLGDGAVDDAAADDGDDGQDAPDGGERGPAGQ